ncbi:PAS domain-containing hybrid sensor histidine kinase/response regulator [Hymenobacter nivis]|uniref:histidine kinase n=1 Tax=Hymenobacter nivis TaxID=1850093 RepID=A0A2Z3H1Q2_9BACT|nr:PAS domain-containing protein [Hymenobacter nivis]AWM34930.1 hypothetical protein DDQ68_20410 [Hymenobacter nivis]
MPAASVASSPLAAARARIRALEAALREAQATSHQLSLGAALSDQNPNPVLRYNAAGERTYANPAAVRLRHQLGPVAAAGLRAQLRALAVQSLRDGRPHQTELYYESHGLQVSLVPLAATGYVSAYLIDVTARHKAERQMIEQQEFYERVLDELPSQVAVFGADQRYRYLNARSVPDEAERRQWLGKTMLDTAGFMGRLPEVATRRHRLMAQAVAERRALEWQEAYTEPDGRVSHFLRYYQPVFGAAGALEFIIAYNADITARVQAEAQLREQQAFTALVLDTTPNVIYVRDLDQNVLFQNQACQLLRAEIVPRHALVPGSVAAGERRAYAADDARVVQNGQEMVAEDCMTLPSGEVRWYHTVKRPLLRPDGAVHVLGVSTDITALKQAQYTLERSEKRYRDLMHYAQALIFTCDLRGTLLSANPMLADLLGVPTEALPGQPVATFLLADDRLVFARYLGRIAATPAAGEAEGVVQVQGPGGVHHLLYRSVVVREAGQAPYIISHAHDITGRVLAEQATQRARKEAEATARARENFLANMSHEIRTPMNGVLGITAQLAKTRLDARQQELVRFIRTSGQHLLVVLNDVLDMAKITAGKLELEQIAFNLCDAMGEALQPLAAQAREKGLAFQARPLRASCPLPWVVGDPHRLVQIMLNLVSNAVKFTEQGSVTVKSEQVGETAATVTVYFSVADTGPGISPGKQALVFENFAQAQADTTRRHGGTGLGLSISRALVEQMGGALTLASAPGVGSTFAFTLVLPRAAVPALAPAGGPVSYDTGRLAGARVLLVEDNEISRTVVRMLLEPWGALLDEVADGAAALARLAAAPYDVVLMDIQLPGLSGVDATARLRQLPDPQRAATPVIALTANAFRADGERYLAAGFNDYLAKPYDEAILYHKMVALLPPPAPAYDLAHLRRLAQGRAPFVLKIIRSFLANAPISLAELRAAAAAHDWPQVARVVHHIKPNLLALGITRPAAAVALLIARPTDPDPAAAPDARAQALAVLLAAVERALGELPAELSAELPA